MSYISNLRIITDLGELNYREVQELNLSFSRIVDDFSDIGNKFGDFSYEFNLPITKENSRIFGAPESIGSKNYFYVNRNIPCKVYNNNQLILDGLINLEGINKTTYKCKFFSKFKELVDTLNASTTNGDKKTLQSLEFPVVQNWQYEKSIIEHIMAQYPNSDYTDYQYPLSFYSTFYCQYSYFSGHTDYQGNYFVTDRAKQNYYYLFNNIDGDDNRIYFHQVPPAIYLVSIVRQILEDAGWTLGGQFFNDENVKKIIYLYAGEDDPYDKAILDAEAYKDADGHYNGSASVDLQIAKFLPDMSQSEFLLGVMNMFNLYFKIDTANKIIQFETYNTFFRATDGVDPYDITNKVDESSGTFGFSYFLNNNPSILFKPAENRKIFGEDKVMTGATGNSTSQIWVSVSNVTYNQTFNRVGYTEQSNVNLNNYVATVEKIEIPFSEPNIKRQYIYNDDDIAGTSQSATAHISYLPILSKQTISNNNGMKFNRKDTENYLFNNEESIKFQGYGSMMYYYGFPTSDFVNKAGKGGIKNYLYYNMYSGGTKQVVPIAVVSPFQLLSYRTAIDNWLNAVTVADIDDRRTTVASYLQALYQQMNASSGFTASQLTDFSLVFDDNGYFHDTLWSTFHKYKWDRYQTSELFTAEMKMNAYDWDQMQINRPLKYKGELYSLVSIEGYNPVTQRATIKMIKKL